MATVTNIVDGGSVVLVSLSDGQQVPFERHSFVNFCEARADEEGNVDLRDVEFEYDADSDPPVLVEVE